MNYPETLDFLYNSLPMYQRAGKAAYKANLDNTIKLDKALNSPHLGFKSIHIAGTNGKGSVSHIVASVLQSAGYKTGLYTSPHLIDFRERIKVNGEMIPEEEVVSFVSSIKNEIEEIKPSFFEMTVAMAFAYFRKEKVDIAVIETGLGGRLDSTNIIIPELTAITNISFDHMEFLGDTIERITKEKAGIIKNKIPVIAGKNSEEALQVIEETARENSCRFVNANTLRTFKYQTNSIHNTSMFHYRNNSTKEDETWECDLAGSYQSENIQTALAIFDMLNEQDWNILPDRIKTGIRHAGKNTRLRGRWEVLGSNPRIIADTAHNEAGISRVFAQIKEIPAKEIRIVWGMVSDKSVDKIARLLPQDAHFYFCAPGIPRAMPVNQLAEKLAINKINGQSYNSVNDAIQAALKDADVNDLIFIGGSTFVVADALPSFQN